MIVWIRKGKFKVSWWKWWRLFDFLLDAALLVELQLEGECHWPQTLSQRIIISGGRRQQRKYTPVLRWLCRQVQPYDRYGEVHVEELCWERQLRQLHSRMGEGRSGTRHGVRLWLRGQAQHRGWREQVHGGEQRRALLQVLQRLPGIRHSWQESRWNRRCHQLVLCSDVVIVGSPMHGGHNHCNDCDPHVLGRQSSQYLAQRRRNYIDSNLYLFVFLLLNKFAKLRRCTSC